MSTAAKLIGELRVEHGMSLRSLAGEAGLNVTKLWRIERGRQEATEDDILRIAAVFGIGSLADFYERARAA